MSQPPRVTYQHVSGLIRVYEPDADTLGDYKAVVSVSWTGHDSVFLFGANGRLQRQDLLAIAKLLYSMGVKRVMMERVERRKMPLARFIETRDGLSLWCIDSLLGFIEGITSRTK